jgi:AmpE protein
VLVAALGELPELRDAMSLVWRILLLWLAVLALFVVAGWVG